MSTNRRMFDRMGWKHEIEKLAEEHLARLDELGVDAQTHVRVRDLWKRTDVGEAQREIVIATSGNSATVLGISPQ